MRALGIDPVHNTRSTFRALSVAMSRPGTIQEAPTTPADHAVVATLVDHEVSFHTADDELRETLASHGRLVDAEPAEADIVHIHGVPAWSITDLTRGSLVEPSEGATVICRVDGLAAETADNHGDPAAECDSGLTPITLSGPGVPDSRTVHVGLPAEELRDIVAAQSTFPRGVDAIFTAGDRLVAVPRSASMEVA
ncbi:MAG: phosphonate C-P lyase system protein PhnH [Halanaeroarchaeum sp.]